MTNQFDRRDVLTSGLAGAALAAAPAVSTAAEDKSPANRVVVGVMGVNGRGTALARGFARLAGAEVAYVCDVDRRAIGKCQEAVAGIQGRKPQGVIDFRSILNDKRVDALVVAAPDHWHGPATILACQHDKHVYVEKPCSHNPHEGELMIAAAEKHRRVVTMGVQRRSWPAVIEGIQKVRGGAIGRVLFSRGWYNNRRPSIGKGTAGDAPSWLDWKLWQGPAPETKYRSNVVHYKWHWFWNWGTGELGNNGVHALDLCRWGLGVDFPTRVTAGGGKYRHNDDQETPDTHMVTYDFDGCSIAWQGLSWCPRGIEGSWFGASFHGDGGSLLIDGAGYKEFDMQNKLVAEKRGAGGDPVHLQNFLDAIRKGQLRVANANIHEAHRSTLLCHLGNIAHRAGGSLSIDKKTGRILENKAAQALWRREYNPAWEPKVGA